MRPRTRPSVIALAALVGTLRAQQLHSDSFGELGDFELRFSPPEAPNEDSGVAVGQLHDLSGPLSLQAQVLLARQNGYQISGTMMAISRAFRSVSFWFLGLSSSPNMTRWNIQKR